MGGARGSLTNKTVLNPSAPDAGGGGAKLAAEEPMLWDFLYGSGKAMCSL